MKVGFTRNKLKYSVDESFFDNWSNQMAYILGFTLADGSIDLNTLAWDIQKRDLNILKKIKKSLSSTYPIRLHRGKSYRMRVSNLLLIGGIVRRGLIPKKKFRKSIPKISKRYARHFLRGYLEGDGWVVLRRNRNELDLGFCSGNRDILSAVNDLIVERFQINPGKVRAKKKVTPKGKLSTTYQLEYYSSNAWRICQSLYGNLNKKDLYLDRKYRKYLDAKDLYLYLESGTKKVRPIQKKAGKPIKEILHKLYEEKGYDGVKIANLLGVHSSSIYRWLARTGIKYPERRLSL